jgi:hypothetical protein
MASGVDIGAILGLQADFQLDSMISLSFTSFQAVIVAIVAKYEKGGGSDTRRMGKF